MKVRIGVVLSLMVVCLAFSSLTFAADEAYLYIVHGLPGRDVSATLDPTLPVDVLVNDDFCSERGITFGNVFGPLALPAGDYDLKISPANMAVPCSNAPIAESNVSLKAGRNVSAIATLDDKGQPTLLTLTNDFASVSQGQARVILSNVADAPALLVTLQVQNSNQKYTYTVNPGKTVIATIPANNYTIEVQANNAVVIPAEPIILPSVSGSLIYIVGEASNGSLALVARTVKDVL